MNIGVERTWREKLLIKELQELKLEYNDLSERFKAQAWEISSLTIENTKLKEDLGE